MWLWLLNLWWLYFFLCLMYIFQYFNLWYTWNANRKRKFVWFASQYLCLGWKKYRRTHVSFKYITPWYMQTLKQPTKIEWRERKKTKPFIPTCIHIEQSSSTFHHHHINWLLLFASRWLLNLYTPLTMWIYIHKEWWIDEWNALPLNIIFIKKA